MAKIVGDSDDDFPDLAIIIGKFRSGAASETAGENQLRLSTTELIRNEAVITPTAKPARTSSNNLNTVTKSPVPGIQRVKSKKRVLNGIRDNPLLQSYNNPKERAPIYHSYNRSEFKIEKQIVQSGVQENSKPMSCPSPSLDSYPDEDDLSAQDSTGLSDFVVNDNSFLEEDSTDGEALQYAPRSTRRLFRGIRSPGRDASDENWSNFDKCSHTQKEIIVSAVDYESFSQRNQNGNFPDISTQKLLDAVRRDICLVTPPSTPLKTQGRLHSPRKGTRIPKTPYRASMDAFWDPGVINEWNEEYSPQTSAKLQNTITNDRLETELPCSPAKKSQVILHTTKYNSKKLFSLQKHDIADAFLRELDKSITDGKIAEMAALTGGISITWSKKLNTTAGRANWKRETVKAAARDVDGELETKVMYRHYASIELAEKVIDDEERLLNVIAHEFCHLANFMVSGIRNNPHGKEFKAWAAKCSEQFGNRGIKVTTKHSYDIDYKYVWVCTNCSTEFKRHSKSIDPIKHQCGSCKSKLVQIKPVPRPKAAVNEYQLFVKENMRKVKEQNPGSPLKQIMTTVGKMYQESKASKSTSLREDAKKIEVSDGKNTRSGEEPPNKDDIDLVMRKLNFLDLENPCVVDP